MRRLLHFWVATLLALPTLAAEENWKKKPPAEWTQEEVLAFLDDSPWAERVEVMQLTGRLLAVYGDDLREVRTVYQEEGAPTPRPLRDEPKRVEPELVRAVYAVRWSSAAIVQQALARLRELSPVLYDLQGPAPDLPTDTIVLTVRVVKPPAEMMTESLAHQPILRDENDRPIENPPPHVSDLFAGLSDDELRARAQLHTAKKIALPPARVLRHGVGAGEGISFFFPRSSQSAAALAPDTAWAEFAFTGRRGDKLKARFKLREMQINGRPDY
ncbi:MAG: hypothetical protein HYY26_01345 [Acidobacteria bacterium]|nr:hypothetical protein [Acidobacteriota bacterium]